MRVRRLLAGAVGAGLLATAVTACTSDDSPDSAAPNTSTGATITLTQPSEPMQVTLGPVRGGVKKKEFGRLKHAIAVPIDAWVSGGFLDSKYPSSDFDSAFASWTPGAADLGKRDRDTTTNAVLGSKLVALVADSQQAKLFVFATDGKTGGATARVALRFTGELSDQSLVHFVVKGDLYLTRKDSKWQIFGYRLDREDVA
jgi:hypothetical protein